MSFSQTYFEELRAQSKDLVEILAHTQEERVLYALCVCCVCVVVANFLPSTVL